MRRGSSISRRLSMKNLLLFTGTTPFTLGMRECASFVPILTWGRNSTGPFQTKCWWASSTTWRKEWEQMSTERFALWGRSLKPIRKITSPSKCARSAITWWLRSLSWSNARKWWQLFATSSRIMRIAPLSRSKLGSIAPRMSSSSGESWSTFLASATSLPNLSSKMKK